MHAFPAPHARRLLDIPPGARWEGLMAADRKKSKSALKGGGGGLAVSAAKAFIGPHPDCGSMRLVLQAGPETGTGANGTWPQHAVSSGEGTAPRQPSQRHARTGHLHV